MEKVIIRNMENSYKIFNLSHQKVCVKAGRCICDPKTGLCSSLHLAANNQAVVVTEALCLKEIRDEIEAKKLVVYKFKRGQRNVEQLKQETPKQIAEQKTENRKPARGRQSKSR